MCGRTTNNTVRCFDHEHCEQRCQQRDKLRKTERNQNINFTVRIRCCQAPPNSIQTRSFKKWQNIFVRLIFQHVRIGSVAEVEGGLRLEQRVLGWKRTEFDND